MQKSSPQYSLCRLIPLAICLSTVMAAPAAFARIGISIKTDRTSYVRYEQVNMTVTVRNYTGNTIRFGSPEAPVGHLTLFLDDHRAAGIQSSRGLDLIGGLVLDPGQTRQLVFKLNNVFRFQREGDYAVWAQVGHPRLPTDYKTPRSKFTVHEGQRIREKGLGVPVAGDDEPIPVRQVYLLLVNEGDKAVYCLRIEDDRSVYAVARLGNFIHGDQPELGIDAVSNIHVLLRDKARLFSYKVFDYSGKLLQERRYVLSGTAPQLFRDPDAGTVTIVGGRPAIRGEDYVIEGGETARPQNMPPGQTGSGIYRVDQTDTVNQSVPGPPQTDD